MGRHGAKNAEGPTAHRLTCMLVSCCMNAERLPFRWGQTTILVAVTSAQDGGAVFLFRTTVSTSCSPISSTLRKQTFILRIPSEKSGS